MDYTHREDLPELAKAYLFNVQFIFDNIPASKEEKFKELASTLSLRVRKIKFLKEDTSDVFTVVEISFDEFEDYLITTCIKNEYLSNFRMNIVHYSTKMQPVYEEKFFDCKAAYVEEFCYDKFDSSQERLVKTIGFKCKRSK